MAMAQQAGTLKPTAIGKRKPQNKTVVALLFEPQNRFLNVEGRLKCRDLDITCNTY